MINKPFSVLLLGLFSSSLFANQVGLSSYPIQQGKHMIGAEMTGITSTGGGVGIQARYTHKLVDQLTLDAGFGVSGGDRPNKFFAGADYEFLPDYMNQPRISVKANYMNAEEFKVRRNIIGLSPTISKGFSFWGKEAYPFLAIPVNLSLDSDSKSYETQIAANIGIAGQLPWTGYQKFTGLLEGTIGIKDSYTGLFVGVSYPFN